MTSRRKFIRQIGGSAALLSAGSLSAIASSKKGKTIPVSENRISSNDKIRVAAIGMGIMGFNDVNTALKVPGIELAAVADLYNGRLTRAKEVYGNSIATTRDYRELLDRKDIDAVIIATSDHWHNRIAIDAMKKGKAVYCEKPMVHHLDQGQEVIRVQKETKAVLQVGSQGVSSSRFAAAKKLYEAGEIGRLNCIEASNDRHSALGAWQYSIPPDASPQTVDWDRYLGNAPKLPYEANRFFRWRNYREYGTGVAGDLFVHLISGIHFITGSLGPEKIYATGQLSYWKDGRNVPDVMTAILDYPETEKHAAFQLTLRVNFASGNGETGYTHYIGTDGVIDLGYGGFTLKKEKLPRAPGYGGWDSFSTFPKAIQEEFEKQYNAKYSDADRRAEKFSDTVYKEADTDDEHYNHFVNFFEGVRSGKPIVEDASFGFRACAPCIACNESYFTGKIIHWDPVNMKVVNK